MSTLTSLIRRTVWSKRHFEFWQRLGINVTRKHFSSPIPDTNELSRRNDLWTEESSLVGLDMNPKGQLKFLEEIFQKYKNELNFPADKADNPDGYYINNAGYGFEDAAVLHCMIRYFKPKLMIEIGAGYSTFVSAGASLLNQKDGYPIRHTAIEPYPRDALKNGFPGLDELIIEKAESMEFGFFDQLDENDILFIDTSHVVCIGNDVNFLFLEVLSRLNKGVVVHIHDIFLPYHYPRTQIIDNQAFWAEQYLLQGFLCLNSAYEILFGNYYMLSKYPEKMKAVFSPPQGTRPRCCNSFWIRRKN